MPQLLRVPEVAANTTEATLVSWPIAENAAYSATDVIAVVETAKAVVDVEAETDGVLLKRLVAEGTDVTAGEPIAVIGAPGESVDDLDSVLLELGASPASSPQPDEGRAVPAADAVPDRAESAVDNEPGSQPDRVFASPLARRLARDGGVAVTDLRGTGPNGRILRRDVERAIANPPVTAGAATEPVDLRARGRADGAPAFVDTPHTRLRRAVAERLGESKRTIPHFYLRGTARVDKLLRLRQRLNEDAPVRISVNDLVVKAVARAHVLVPALNVVWTPDAVRSFDTVDLGVAITTTRGLFTPVVRRVEQTSISALAATIRDLATRAECGQLQQHELEGGSASVTNLGMFGAEEFAAIINPPQASILAVGAVREEALVAKGKLRIGSVMRVTLSVDHRPVDGASAAQWMRAFLSVLEHPVQILA